MSATYPLPVGTRFKSNGDAMANTEVVLVVMDYETDETQMYHGPDWIHALEEHHFTGETTSVLAHHIFKLDEIGEIL